MKVYFTIIKSQFLNMNIKKTISLVIPKYLASGCTTHVGVDGIAESKYEYFNPDEYRHPEVYSQSV
jgi:hypothetical protein